MAGKMGYIHSKRTIEQFMVLTDALAQLNGVREKRYDIGKTAISYRTINYWEQVGLLDDQRTEQGHGWRKFSIIDIAFISLITHLRNIGLSIDVLKNTKRCLTGDLQLSYIQDQELITYKSEKHMTMMEFAYARALGLKDGGNTYLLIETSGFTEVMTEKDLHMNRIWGELPDTYIYINLNSLFKKTVNDKFIVWDEKTHVLDGKGEEEVFYKLRDNNNKLEINKNNDGVITDIDVTSIYAGSIDGDGPDFGEIIKKRADANTVCTMTITKKRIS